MTEIETIKNNPLKLLRRLKADMFIYIISGTDNWYNKNKHPDLRIASMESVCDGYKRYKKLKKDYMTMLKLVVKYGDYRRSGRTMPRILKKEDKS